MIRETYRGVKLAARAGRKERWGYVEQIVRGVSQGWWLGSEEDALRTMRAYVDAAYDRPEAYGPEYLPPPMRSPKMTAVDVPPPNHSLAAYYCAPLDGAPCGNCRHCDDTASL